MSRYQEDWMDIYLDIEVIPALNKIEDLILEFKAAMEVAHNDEVPARIRLISTKDSLKDVDKANKRIEKLRRALKKVIKEI